MNRVFIASPYAGDTLTNCIYARAAVRDSFLRGEAPYCPHLAYTQIGREASLNAAKQFLAVCDILAVYEDKGVSAGMQGEIEFAITNNIPIQFRDLPELTRPYPVLKFETWTIFSDGTSDNPKNINWSEFLDNSTFNKSEQGTFVNKMFAIETNPNPWNFESAWLFEAVNDWPRRH